MITFVRPLRSPQGNLVSPIAEDGASPMDPSARARTVGPFVVMAHFDATFAPGEAPQDLDVRPHPHIGIATLTYLFEGAITHRDGLGSVAEIGPRDISWMVAGRGVVHSERYPTLRRKGGRLHGLQIWVALSERDIEAAPSFVVVPAAELPVVETGGARVRRLLGRDSRLREQEAAFGLMWLSEVELAAGAAYEAPAGAEGALYVIEGSVEVGGRALTAGETALFDGKDDRRFTAREPARAVSFGGDPIGTRYLWWNYLHARVERIDEAKAAWRERRYAMPADDQDDVIPLPADHERPLRILNAP